MRKLVIGFSRPKKWNLLSALIMWWDTHTYGVEDPASHSYVRFCSASWGVDFIYQNSGPRTNFVGGRRFTSLNHIVEEYELEIPDEHYNKIGVVCVEREGKPYALLQLIGQAVVFMAKLVSFNKASLDNPFKDGDSATTCIEEVYRVLKEAFGIPSVIESENISVKQFRDWVGELSQAKKR